MIDHIGIAVADLDKAIEFYKAALAPLGYELIKHYPGMAAGFGISGKPDFWISPRGTGGPGVHVCFRAATRKLVDAFYAAAIAAGGKDNGAPGVRAMYHPNYYGGFVHDTDGHNVEACCHEPYLG